MFTFARSLDEISTKLLEVGSWVVALAAKQCEANPVDGLSEEIKTTIQRATETAQEKHAASCEADEDMMPSDKAATAKPGSCATPGLILSPANEWKQ